MKKIFTLLLLLCFTLLCFNFTSKAYYDPDTSYVYVYLDGIQSIRVPSATLDEYAYDEDKSSFSSCGWPSAWVSNNNVINKSFDVATLDLAGNNVINSFDSFYELWSNAFTISGATGSHTLNLYLWFTDTSAESNYAELYFYYDGELLSSVDLNQPYYSGNNDFVYWNTDYSLTYSNIYDIVKDSSNSFENGYFTVDGSIIDTTYSQKLEGGASYTIDYVLADSSGEYEYFKEEYWDTLYFSSSFLASNNLFLLPKKCCGFDITWYVDTTNYDFLSLNNSYSSTEAALTKVYLPSSNKLVLLHATIIAPNENGEEQEFEEPFYITVYSDKQQLGTPNVSISSSKMYWDSIDNCYSYGIYIDDECIATTSNTFYYLPGAIEELGNYTLTVKALSTSPNFSDSNHSNFIVYHYNNDYLQIATPVLSIEDSILSWEAVYNAAQYELYCNLNLVKTFNADVLSFDINELNLSTGDYEFRLKALAGDLSNYSDSLISAEVPYTQLGKTVSFYYGNELVKTISYSSIASKYSDSDQQAEYFKSLIPDKYYKNNILGYVNGYYLDTILTDEIESDIIFHSWKAVNFVHLDIYLDLVFPLNYSGPTLIYKNPSSYLDTSIITHIVNDYCKIGAMGVYSLSILSDFYTGNGSNPGDYVITFKVIVGDYITEIPITIRVTNLVKVDYLYEGQWFTSSIISKEDLILTAKNIQAIPNTELAYSIVSYNEVSKLDFYAENADSGDYSFLINYNSTSGQKGLYQFKMKYFLETPYDYVEEKSFDPTILIFVIVVGLGIVIIIFYNTVIKKTNKKTKKEQRYSNKKYSNMKYNNYQKNNYYNNYSSKKKRGKW